MESKLIVTISSLNEEGKGICFVDDNLIEIEGALPGDELEIIITRKLKNKYIARIHKYLNENNNRENKCKLFGICCNRIQSV